MANIVLTNMTVSLNGSQLSGISKAMLEVSADDVETTSFSSSGWRSRIGGLQAANLSLSLFDDFATGALDATLWPLLNSVGTVVLTPNGTAVSASNPKWTFNVLINSLPVGGQVGDIATKDLKWPVSGTVTRATA
jgi:hypothetical protein